MHQSTKWAANVRYILRFAHFSSFPFSIYCARESTRTQQQQIVALIRRKFISKCCASPLSGSSENNKIGCVGDDVNCNSNEMNCNRIGNFVLFLFLLTKNNSHSEFLSRIILFSNHALGWRMHYSRLVASTHFSVRPKHLLPHKSIELIAFALPPHCAIVRDDDVKSFHL